MSSVPAAEPLAEFLPRPKPTGWRPVWFLAAWYALAPMIGFSETFGLVSSRLMYLQTFGPSLCLAGWAITDSIRRRRPIPILSWDWYTLAAVVLVPLYVVRGAVCQGWAGCCCMRCCGMRWSGSEPCWPFCSILTAICRNSDRVACDVEAAGRDEVRSPFRGPASDASYRNRKFVIVRLRRR